MGYLGGFAVTLRQIGRRQRVTREYVKDEGGKRDKAVRTHGRHVLNRYEDGMEKCIGCELCAGVCPARCIFVRGRDNPPDAPVSPGERYGYVYEINYLRCIHCDLCVEACPTEAITETKLFEFSFVDRADAIYTRDELLVGDDGRPKQLPWEDWSDAEAIIPLTSAWVRATAASGDASYEGKVAWSGELGFGVKPAEAGQTAEVDQVPGSGEELVAHQEMVSTATGEPVAGFGSAQPEHVVERGDAGRRSIPEGGDR
ncbi:MAG: NADH-quinone oxidoreductase subunit I [Actinobacteria bacterium]|nr:NADH-quinone oxidoreductase subunit I [Actinomycetota bacterium]